MKHNYGLIGVVLAGTLLSVMIAQAATHYVVTNGTPGVTSTDPYTNWATAGTNIIDVVNAAATNNVPRLVWVTNGTYYPTNNIYVNVPITLRSVNGREVTTLYGGNGLYTNLCAVFGSSANPSVFDGFTIANYYKKNNIAPHGIINSYGLSLLNCTFTGNTNAYGAGNYGFGGVWIQSSGAVTNCIFRNNRTIVYYGAIAGMYIDGSFTVSGCIIENNYADIIGGGLGLIMSPGGSAVISNCIFRGNHSTGRTSDAIAGGLYLDGTSRNITVVDCTIISNTVPSGVFNGGGIGGNDFILRNCLVAYNSGASNGGGLYISSNAFIESCTIVSNKANTLGGGVYITGVNVTGINNIIYYNTAPDGANFTNLTGNAGLERCCVIPVVNGTGNITNDPALIDLTGGNYRLQPNSPCMNTGTNQSWMTNSVDLDGRGRIRYGVVDMGAYETIYEGTVYRIGF